MEDNGVPKQSELLAALSSHATSFPSRLLLLFQETSSHVSPWKVEEGETNTVEYLWDIRPHISHSKPTCEAGGDRNQGIDRLGACPNHLASTWPWNTYVTCSQPGQGSPLINSTEFSASQVKSSPLSEFLQGGDCVFLYTLGTEQMSGFFCVFFFVFTFSSFIRHQASLNLLSKHSP